MTRPSPLRHSRAAAALLVLVGLSQMTPIASAQAITGFGGFAPVNTFGTPAGGINGTGTTFQLTNAGLQAASAFHPNAQNVSGIWSAEFTYATQDGADGFTFTMQNDPRGTMALGGPGGALGYREDAGAGAMAITPSAAYAVNIFGADTTGVRTNGGTGTMTGVNALSTTIAQQPMRFKLTYVAGRLTGTIINPNNAATANPAFNVRTDSLDILGTIGPTALVGFTGASGGVASNQTLGSFRFRTAAGLGYTPVAVTGFNADPVVDIGSPTPAGVTNSSIDNGFAATGDTFYERGQNLALPTRGMPMGQTFISENDTAHTFALAPANGNNALLINKTTPTTLTFTTPVAYEGLSILSTTGNGSSTYNATVKFADGAPDEVITGALSTDWFNAGGGALTGLGRMNQAGAYNQDTGTNPRIYQQDFLLENTLSPIAGIEFLQTSGNSAGANTFIFGVSGIVNPVPEPATVGLAAAAGLLLIRRRGRRGLTT